jgi:hypothetical protein
MATTPPPIDPGTLPVTGYQLTAAMQAIGQQIADALAKTLQAVPPTKSNLAQRADYLEKRVGELEEILYDPTNGAMFRVANLEALVATLTSQMTALKAAAAASVPPVVP